MHCASLVFRRYSLAKAHLINDKETSTQCVYEFQEHESVCEVGGSNFQSPLHKCSNNGQIPSRTMKVSKDLTKFNSKLQEQKWSQQVGQGATIGLALVSRRNVTHVMRETLSLLFDDFCSFKSRDETCNNVCQPLVDILGVFTHSQGVESSALNCLLQPYHAYTISKWVHRPLSSQSETWLKSSGMQLLQALPPVPLALAFITLLLEQKVCIFGSCYQCITSHQILHSNMFCISQWCLLAGSIRIVQKRNAYCSVFWNVAAIEAANVGTLASSTRPCFHDERTHTLSSSFHARVPYRRER